MPHKFVKQISRTISYKYTNFYMIVSPQAIYQRELLTETTEEIAGEDYLEPYPSVPIKRLSVCKSGISE